MERLEQVQLAEDLAAQRDQYMKERHNEKEKYREALATQVGVMSSAGNVHTSSSLVIIIVIIYSSLFFVNLF